VKITDHYRATAQWLHDWAMGYETGLAQHHTAGVEDSQEMASRLRHRARNIEATINAYERLTQ
jgi:hypothetical protein